MRHVQTFVFFLLMVLCLAACRTNQIVPTVTTYKLDPKITDANSDDYKVKPGDKLLIKNLNWISDLVPEPSAIAGGNKGEGLNLSVDVNGQIGLPEIGKVTVVGLTQQGISDTLSILYKDIIRNPIFETHVTNLRVKVLGAVVTQGLVVLEKEYESLGEVLARSGGIKYTEAGNVIQIIRGQGTSQRVIEYDFKVLGDPLIMNQPVFDNDIVYIPPTASVVRAARTQRTFAIVQPLFLALNMVVLILNLTR